MYNVNWLLGCRKVFARTAYGSAVFGWLPWQRGKVDNKELPESMLVYLGLDRTVELFAVVTSTPLIFTNC